MVNKRRRFKQTTTLAERLAAQAGRLRDRAKTLPPGAEQTQLWRKVRQAETALRIDQWLSGVEARADVVTPLGKGPKRHYSSKSPHEPT